MVGELLGDGERVVRVPLGLVDVSEQMRAPDELLLEGESDAEVVTSLVERLREQRRCGGSVTEPTTRPAHANDRLGSLAARRRGRGGDLEERERAPRVAGCGPVVGCTQIPSSAASGGRRSGSVRSPARAARRRCSALLEQPRTLPRLPVSPRHPGSGVAAASARWRADSSGSGTSADSRRCSSCRSGSAVSAYRIEPSNGCVNRMRPPTTSTILDSKALIRGGHPSSSPPSSDVSRSRVGLASAATASRTCRSSGGMRPSRPCTSERSVGGTGRSPPVPEPRPAR